jgi:anti-sigma regulatory factor (Ser/Thr protein kinase)
MAMDVPRRRAPLGPALNSHALMHDVDMLLTPVPQSVTEVRRVARAAVSAPWSSDGVEVIALCATELVANAIRYGRPPISFSLRAQPEAVTIEVTDTGDELPTPRDPGPGDQHGRGLRIVEQLAEQWGVDRLPEGKRVWCRVTPASWDR